MSDNMCISLFRLLISYLCYVQFYYNLYVFLFHENMERIDLIKKWSN